MILRHLRNQNLMEKGTGSNVMWDETVGWQGLSGRLVTFCAYAKRFTRLRKTPYAPTQNSELCFSKAN